MYKKTLLSLALASCLAACGNDGSAPSNERGAVEISGAVGAPSVGETLVATVSDPDGVEENSVIYAWYANGAVIAGATGSSYQIQQTDVGKTLYVTAGYKGGNGVRESTTSATTAAVPSSVSVQAVFVHGLVTGGSCQVYSVTGAGAKGTSLATAMTSNGSVDFGNIEYTGTGLIECTGGTYTDEATGATLTAPLTRAVVNMSASGQFVVSPLTELAVQLAEANGGLNTALSTYNTQVANSFGLTTGSTAIDITRQAPVDLQTTAASNNAAGKYATVLALFSQLDENQAGDAAAVIADLAADLNDGTLSVATIQLLATAKNDLLTSAVAANLNTAALDAISVDVGFVNTAGSAQIEGSASVGSTLTAVVSDANGTGTINYQWYADDVVINGATSETYTVQVGDLGAEITVSATYTDGAGFAEQLTSAAVGPVATDAVNTVGVLGNVSGVLTIGQDVSVAAPTDANGLSGSVSYQWQANGQDIADANATSFTLTAAQLGAAISVTATYTDDDGFAEALSSSAPGIVLSARVSNQTELATAVSGAASGDLIGLQAGNYANMAALTVGEGVTLMAVNGQTPVISGTTCIVLSSNSKIDGLTFSNLTLLNSSDCASNGPSSVYMSGDSVTLSNNTFASMVTGLQYNYVALKGFQSVIERNSFAGKDVDQNGGYITMYANDTVDSNAGHIIRYNHFRDSVSPSGNASSRNSSAYAVQIGRSTGTDGQYDGLTTIEYNLFSNMMIDRRLVKVQSSRNTIHGNTIIGSTGMIALEDGFGSTASSNIIISNGDDGDDGGISFAQLGHTIVDNYINNIRTTSSQRAALMINSDPLSGDGNKALIAQALDVTLKVARNTVVNAQQAIVFEDIDCNQAGVKTILDFDSNLIANQDSGSSINGNTNGSGRTIVKDADFIAEPCTVDAASDYDNNHFYSQTLSESGTFTFKVGVDGNVLGEENGATLTEPNANNMVEGSGADAGIGADIDGLTFITSDMVGPGSTWTVAQP